MKTAMASVKAGRGRRFEQHLKFEFKYCPCVCLLSVRVRVCIYVQIIYLHHELTTAVDVAPGRCFKGAARWTCAV